MEKAQDFTLIEEHEGAKELKKLGYFGIRGWHLFQFFSLFQRKRTVY